MRVYNHLPLNREALLVFKSAESASNAVKEFQGWELAGNKLLLYHVTSVAIDEDIELSIMKANELANKAASKTGML